MKNSYIKCRSRRGQTKHKEKNLKNVQTDRRKYLKDHNERMESTSLTEQAKMPNPEEHREESLNDGKSVGHRRNNMRHKKKHITITRERRRRKEYLYSSHLI